MKEQHQRPPVLIPERVKFLKKIESKKCVFDTVTQLLEKGQSEVNKNDIFDALIEREKLGDTYLGNGIAVPRAFINITNPRAALLILKKGLKLNTADKKDINFILAVLLPEANADKHTKMMQNVQKKLLKQDNMEKILGSANVERIAEHFNNLF